MQTFCSPIGHIARTAASLSPLLIYEFVKDPERQQRWARIAILGATMVEQIIWAVRVRRRERESRDRSR